MNVEEHNKFLAYSHLGYAAFQLFMTCVMAFFLYFAFEMMRATPPYDAPPASIVTAVIVFVILLQMLFTVPSIFAGFGLLKRRSWARTAGFISGVMAAMSFPVGTAVCVYTFWFLLGEGGKQLYPERATGDEYREPSFLNEPSEASAADAWRKPREGVYAPPREMPNWRD